MQRLLLISYHFAPEPNAGALRAGALFRYLPECGWEVDLVTRAPFGGAAVVIPHTPWIEWLRHDLAIRPDLWFRAPPTEFRAASFIEKPTSVRARAWGVFRRSALQLATWPDRAIGWHRATRSPVTDFVRTRRPDAILSTSPPDTVHFIARHAARVSGSPWIADLRDPWSGTQLMDRPRWRTQLDRATERIILASAAGLTTVSAPIREALEQIHPGLPVREIRNGFDPNLFPGRANPDRTSMTVLYAGTITFGRQDVETFLAGAREFLRHNSSVPLSIRFLGETSAALRGLIARYDLERVAVCEPRIRHEDAAAAMRTAAANLYLPWLDPSHPGVYTGKLFEYLGARRPILAVGSGGGVAEQLLEQTGAGRIARDVAGTRELLEQLWSAHSRDGDAWVASEAAVARYSHREMVRQFAEELDRATRGRVG